MTRGVGNSRGRRKIRVVSPVIGQAGCPGQDPGCLKPAGTWVGVSARMYDDLNSLRDRAKEGRGSKDRHAGTGEGISARIHVANSHADRAEDGRRSDRRHSANSRSARGCVSHYRSKSFNWCWKLMRIKKRTDRAYSKRGCHPTHCTHWSIHQLGFLPRVNEADSSSKKRSNWNGGTDYSESSPGWPRIHTYIHTNI